MTLLEVGVIHLIKVENVETFGWESAIRGMRNPLNSWEKSDSDCITCCLERKDADCADCKLYIGPADLKLMRNLARAGSDHAKYLRMINVSMDITAPLYWWKEFDTYKVGTVANSCSTMHKIHDKEFTLDDFSHEHLIDGMEIIDENDDMEYYENPTTCLKYTIRVLNFYRNKFLETKDKKYWWQMIQLLPSSYNQRRTVQMNYQVCWNMYQARQGHKLDEWRQLCTQFEALPYFADIFLDY